MSPALLRGLSLCREDCAGHDRNLFTVTLLASAARAALQRRAESRRTAGSAARMTVPPSMAGRGHQCAGHWPPSMCWNSPAISAFTRTPRPAYSMAREQATSPPPAHLRPPLGYHEFPADGRSARAVRPGRVGADLLAGAERDRGRRRGAGADHGGDLAVEPDLGGEHVQHVED